MSNEEQTRQNFLAVATEESVLAEVKQVLEFARDYFRMRGRTILSMNIDCQLGFFNSAKDFDLMDEQNVVPVSADDPA
jgi:hypothetical protein